MEKLWLKNWPADTPTEPRYDFGQAPVHEYLRQRAKQAPDKIAMIFYGREISYKELDQASDRFASHLHKKGVKKGDRVGIFMVNCPQYAIAHFGVQKLGAIVCPCSPLFKEMELEYEINDAGIEILVCLDILLPVVQKVMGGVKLRQVIVGNLNDYLPENPTIPLVDMMAYKKQAIPGVVDFMDVVNAEGDAPPQVDIDLDQDIALFQYTGGTTGMPKGCMLSHKAALFKTACVCLATGMDAQTVNLVNMPIFHIAGMVAGMNSTLFAGGTQILMTMFDPTATMEAISRYKVNFWYSAVPMNVAVMKHPAIGSYDLSSLKLCLTSSFGIQLTEEISAQWGAASKGGLLLEGAYGLSETHTADTFMPRQKVKYGTCGIPGPQQEFKIVDLTDPDKELPVGEQGEIVLRNPACFKGYWNRPEETAGTLRDGWVHTGDIGKFDDDGYLYLLGRKKEMIKVSGFSVFPEEVELLLNRYPGVAQTAVIGVPDDQKGEVVKAFVVMQPDKSATEQEIIAWAKEKMSTYKAPKYVEFRASLPTLGTGKLLRRALKE